jgi:hypothetical protein
VELSSENTEWFETNYPKASYSWVLDMLMTKFRENQTLTPDMYAEIAAKHLARELREEQDN